MQQAEADPQDKGDDRPEEEASLAGVGPDRAQSDPGAAARPLARHIAHQIAIAGGGVRSGEIEAAEARVDRPAPGAGEYVHARTGRLEQQRVGQAGGAGLHLVALRPFGLELADDVVMAVGRRLRGPKRIAAGVRQLIEQRRIIDAAWLAIEGRVGGARDRDRRLDAVGCIHARHDDPRKGASRANQILDRQGEAPQREGLARARGTGDRRQERRLDLFRHAKLRQRLHDQLRLEHVSSFGRVGEENRLGRFRRERRQGRLRARRCMWRRVWRRRDRPYIPRASVEQANLRFFADLGQSTLLNASAHCGQGADALSPWRGAVTGAKSPASQASWRRAALAGGLL